MWLGGHAPRGSPINRATKMIARNGSRYLTYTFPFIGSTRVMRARARFQTMFRIIAVTAMAALAAAQSEFSANDGSINIETREGENKVFISISLLLGSNPTAHWCSTTWSRRFAFVKREHAAAR